MGLELPVAANLETMARAQHQKTPGGRAVEVAYLDAVTVLLQRVSGLLKPGRQQDSLRGALCVALEIEKLPRAHEPFQSPFETGSSLAKQG
jgi:hypothetical protein